MFKSKWGFHPCDFVMFTKLKKLHKEFWKGRSLVAKHQRWKNKKPENRIGKEPKVPDIYQTLLETPIVTEFHRARHGVENAEMVKPLKFPAILVDTWLQELNEV